MIAVKFLINDAPYKAGDIAGVDDSIASKLIGAKIAVPHGKAVEAAPVDKQIKSPKRKK